MPPLWSFPGVVKEIDVPYVNVELDLGLRLYAPTPIRIVGVNPDERDRGRLTELLPVGARVLAVCEGLPGGPVRAHLTLPDGRDVGAVMRGRRAPAPLEPLYGGTLDKVWTYPAAVVRVTDGDTAQVRLTTGSPVDAHIPVRVAHVNAPEHGTPEGDAATVWAAQTLPPGMLVTVTSHRLDLYGRVLGTIVLPDGADYSTELLAAGHAVPYEGGAR